MTALQPSAILTARYARAFDAAVIVVVAGWHLAGAGSLLAAHLGDYRSDPFQIAGWLALAAAIAAGSVHLLRGSAEPGPAWMVAGAAFVISTAVAAACPPGRMLETDWAWGTAGWIGLLAMLRRPVAEFVIFLTLEALATLGVLLHDDPHRLALAGFITVLFSSAGLQLAACVAARALNVTAQQAAEAAAREAAATTQKVIADRLYTARRSRWLALQETLGPPLSGLAAGSADPGDDGVRRRCGAEAASLRRLFAESDYSPNPLIHELLATADVAERRGVAVDIETLGAIPVMPPEIRRAITDIAIAALTAAVSRARVIVNATGAGIAVSFLIDSPAGTAVPASAPGLVVESQRDGDDLWMEAQWTVS